MFAKKSITLYLDNTFYCRHSLAQSTGDPLVKKCTCTAVLVCIHFNMKIKSRYRKRL